LTLLATESPKPHRLNNMTC